MIRSARLVLLSWAGGLCLLSPGAWAADERLCALKRIEATGDGVTLWFTAARQVVLMHGDQEGDLYTIDAAARESEGSGDGPKTRHALALRAGEEAVVRNTGNERCSIILARRNGKVGVDVGLSGPGWEGKRTTPKTATSPRYEKFLPAE
jgi:hypothetical protein